MLEATALPTEPQQLSTLAHEVANARESLSGSLQPSYVDMQQSLVGQQAYDQSFLFILHKRSE